MRTLVAILFLAAVAFADNVDWDNIRFEEVYPVGYERIMTSGISDRIVGGQSATLGQFPYQVGLILTVSGGQSFCGGSLISKRTVLTAAHCVDSATRVDVYLGSVNIKQSSESARQVISVARSNFVIHSGWNRNTLANDIALIKLTEDAKLGTYIKVVKLPSSADSSKTYVGDTAVASGWGKPSDSATGVSEVLRYTDLKVIALSTCQSYFGSSARTSNICTSGSDRKSTCNGDSGGPLAIGSGDNRVVIGLTSYGSASGCEKGYPAVFTSVGYYLSWISSNMA